MRNLKASRLEVRFGNAAKNQKVLSYDELCKFRNVCEKEGIEKIKVKIRSLYYGHKENKYKDARKRKNWCIRHNAFAD